MVRENRAKPLALWPVGMQLTSTATVQLEYTARAMPWMVRSSQMTPMTCSP